MKKRFTLIYLILFSGIFQFAKAQTNIRVSVKNISVAQPLDCDAGSSDNSDFVFEYKAQDNSPSAFSNNNPVAGSIGLCNYAVVNEDNGPYSLTPLAPGAAVFSPTTGIFFDRSYNCKNEVPTILTLTWRAYENDDATAPSLIPVADGIIAADVNTYTVPASNGTYTIQYTQSSSDGTCPQTYIIEFDVKRSTGVFSPLTLSSAEGNVICTGTFNGVVEANITGGSGTVLYDWSHDGLSDYDDNSSEPGLAAGTYTIVVKDNLNCTDTAFASVISANPPSNITSFIMASDSVCAGQSNVPYSVATQSNVIYYWNFSGAGAVISGTGSAIAMDFSDPSYNGVLSVYAQNECSVSPSLTMAVTVMPSPIISVSGNTTMCNNTQQTITASGASTYSWSTGETTAGITISPTVTTVYSITATDLYGCISVSGYTMNVLPSPTLQVTGSTMSVCPQQTVAVSASGNGSLFIWSDGFIGANHSVQAAATTIYTVTNTFANSCYAQKTYTLNVYPGPSLMVAGNTIVCEGASVSFTASGANSYAWSNGVNTNTNAFIPVASGSIMVVGMTSDGCKDSLTKMINVVSTPTVMISGNDTICEGQSATLMASANGTVTYGWNSGANTASISVSPSGTFTYVVTADNGGCTGSASHEVYVRLIPTIDVAPVPLLCTTDPPYTLSATPIGGTFLGGGVSGNQFDPSTGPGIYSITYTLNAGSGCTASSTQTIEVDVCTGLKEKDQLNSFSLFPNPAVADITLQSDRLMSMIWIYDYSGKLVKQIELNALQTTLDLTNLAKGFYTLAVMMEDHTQKTVKVVKE